MAAKKPVRGKSTSTGKRAIGGRSGAKSSARSTISSPARHDAGADSSDELVAKMEATEALAAAMPFNANKPAEYGKATAGPAAGRDRHRRRRARDRQHADRVGRLGQDRRRRAPGVRRREPAARSRARRLQRPAPDDQPGRAGRRQPAHAEGGPARAGVAGGLHPPRKDHPLRSRAHPGAHRPRARLGRPRLLRVHGPADRRHARRPVRRGWQADAGVRALLDGHRRARLARHAARRARVRGEVLHRRGELGPGRQQHPGLLHPGRDEVPRPDSRRQARAALRDPAGGHGARHVLGLHLADARVDPHDDVGDVRPDAAAQLPDDAGLRRAHLPVRRRRRQVDVREVPLEPGRGHPLAGLGRELEDLRRRPRLSPARPVGVDRVGRLPRVGAGRAALLREAGRGVLVRRARRDEDRPRRAGAGASGRAAGAEPQPRQLLRRDRAGRVLRGARGAGHRLQQRPAAGGAHPLVRRHADHAPRRPELSRDPDQRVGRAGAQQPARRLSPAGHQPRARRVRAELAGGRLPVPGGARGRLHVVPRADRRRQGARQPREVRRPLHAGDAVLEQPDAHRTAAHPAWLPVRADQGAGAGHPAARRGDAGQRRPRPGPDAGARSGDGDARPDAEGVEASA